MLIIVEDVGNNSHVFSLNPLDDSPAVREVRVRDVRLAFRGFKSNASAERIKAGKSYRDRAERVQRGDVPMAGSMGM